MCYGLWPERDEAFLGIPLGHSGAIPKKLLDVALCKDGREETSRGETQSVLGQRYEYPTETSRYVGHLNPQGDRAFAKVQRRVQKSNRFLYPRSRWPFLLDISAM